MRGKCVKYILPIALITATAFAADLVPEVREAAARGDFQRALSYVHTYETQHGQTPELILALSWMGRDALGQKKYSNAEAYAQETYKRSLDELKKRPLDRESDLPLALGAAIEVQAQVLAARGQRGEAVAYLRAQLDRFLATSIHARIQKNINLLSLEGKQAPALKGTALPSGRPALIFFWAHWCGDCRAEADTLARLKREYGPRGLVLIGPTQKYGYVAGGEDAPANVEVQYIEQIRKQYYAAVIDGPAVVDEQNFLTYGVSTTPTLVLADRRGIVRLYHPGAMSYDELHRRIEPLLNAK